MDDQLIKLFIKIFNEAYQSYINNISPIVFMNTLLEKIINITESKSGLIGGTITINDKKYITLEAFNNKLIVCDEMNVPYSLLIDIDDANDNTVCSSVVRNNNYIIINDSEIYKKVYDNDFKNCIDVQTCICLPISFNSEIVGVLFLANRINYDASIVKPLQKMCDMIGTLKYNYTNLKITSVETDNRYITYQLMEHILNSTQDGTIITDNNFDIIYTNQAAQNIIYLSPEFDPEFGSNLIKYYSQLSVLANTDKLHQKLFKNKKIPVKINNISLEFTVTSTICQNMIYHIFMIFNQINNFISNQKSHTNFIAFLSHELRNPLQSINLANYLMQTELKSVKLTDKSIQYMDSINKSCGDMKKIISDILDLSKIEAHELVIELNTCLIKNLCNDLIEDNISIAALKGIKLVLTIDNNVPNTLYTDEVRLFQILTNLITNAIKYSSINTSDEINIVKLEVIYDVVDHGVKFSVIDKGNGIKKSDLSNIFRQHCQTTSSDKFNSNGLGLCISQKMANLLGGYISVVSEFKKGSTFTLFHPISLENSGIHSRSSYLNKLNTIGNLNNLDGMSILVLAVDDNESNLNLLRLMFEHINYKYNSNIEIHLVKDGKDAIEICKINTYFIIFMDINMPGIDGATASKIIKSSGYSGKIVATTGNILAKKENMMYNSSIDNNSDKYSYFDDVIIKPYDDVAILKVLTKYAITNN